MSTGAGQDTGYVIPTDISVDVLLGVGIALVVLAGLFVAARLWANWRHPSKHIDDALSVIALGLVAGTLGGYYRINQATSNPTTTPDELLDLSYATTWVGSLAMWSSKAPILLLYILLFGIKTWVKIVSITTLVVTGIIFLTMASFVTAKCSPNGATVDASFIAVCSKASTQAGIVLGITSVVADGVIFVIPIPAILRLKLTARKKIGLCLIFSTGLAAIAASAVSANYKWKSLQGIPEGTIGSMLCTVVECAVALMVGCVPALNSFWSHIVVTSALYSRLTSAFSQRSLNPSLRSGRSGGSRSTRSGKRSGMHDGSSENINDSAYDVRNPYGRPSDEPSLPEHNVMVMQDVHLKNNGDVV